MSDPIQFYFDFASPYAYFGSHLIGPVALRHRRAVVWRPVFLGIAHRETGSPSLHSFHPIRAAYFWRDIDRCAEIYGIPWRRPDVLPINSLAAARAFYWVSNNDPGLAQRFAAALLRAYWTENLDISKAGAVAAVAATQGLDTQALTAALAGDAIKLQLRHATDESIRLGVFGVPFFDVDGEHFWGADRVAHIDSWLARRGQAVETEQRGLSGIKEAGHG